jgi:serine palmitoyltransferase
MLVIDCIPSSHSMSGAYPDALPLYNLKNKYNFTLLSDECHSFLAIGRTGRGFYEQYCDDHEMIPDFVDVRTGGFGKSMGSHGGWITCTKKYAARMRERQIQFQKEGEDPLFICSLLFNLYNLYRLEIVYPQLHMLHAGVDYMRTELIKAGLYIYGQRPSPIVAVGCGRLTTAGSISVIAYKVIL